jgi:serine/threonine protein kinase/WD40 repeat protein
MKTAGPQSASRDSVLARLMEDYLASCEAGSPLTAAELAARYPELTEQVEACLASLEFIRRAAESRSRPPDGTVISDALSFRDSGPAGPAGPTLLGDFRILREIGRGGMGVVYEAEQISLARRVAVKVLPFAGVLDARQLQRFKNEALAAAQLDHPHIVNVLAVGSDHGTHFYAMRFIDGRTLAEEIRREGDRGEGTGDMGQRFRAIAALMADAADALHYAHEHGVIHRDVKPSNLMLDEQGKIWVTDFGLAHVESTATLTMTGDFLGTLRYMSPEQALGKMGVDHRTDVYSLGATLYELLTLRPVFDSDQRAVLLQQIANQSPQAPRQLDRTIPAELETITLKALEKEPAERFGTAGELASDLRRFLADQPIRARPPTLLQAARKWSRRHRPVVVASSVATAVLLVVIAAAASWAALAASAREREQKRDGLIQQIQLLRLLPHKQGWFDVAWSRVVEASRIKADPVLRSEAAALLAGVDARLEKSLQPLASSSIAFCPRGRLLAIGGTRQTRYHPGRGATLWNAERYEELHRSPHEGVGPVAFRGETAVQLVATTGPGLLLWDVGGERMLRELALPADDPKVSELVINDLGMEVTAISREAEFVAAAARRVDGSGIVIVWDGTTGQPVLSRPLDARGLAFSIGGRLLAIGDRQGRVAVWSVDESRELAAFEAGRATIHCLAFSEDQRLLAIGGSEGLLAVWDWEAARAISHCRGAMWNVYTVAFSPDRVTLASAGRDHARLWDTATGRTLLEVPSRDQATGLSFSPDGKRLAISAEGGFDEGGVFIYAIDNGRGTQTLRGLDTQVARIWMSPDGKWLAGLAQNWQLGVWELATSRLIHALDAPRGASADNAAVAFSPDGREVAFATSGAARVWEIESGREVRAWQLPPALQDSLAWQAAGQLILVREETRDMRHGPFPSAPASEHPRVLRVRDLFAARPLEPLFELDEFRFGAFPVLLSPDGQHLAVLRVEEGGQQRQAIKVFEVATGSVRWSYNAPRDVELFLDATGTLLGIRAGEQTTLTELATGKLMATVNSGATAAGPAGRLMVRSRAGDYLVSRFGYSLFRRGEVAPLVDLSLDQNGWTPQFNVDGRLLASGNPDGSVSVHDLIEIQRRLAGVGLGW